MMHNAAESVYRGIFQQVAAAFPGYAVEWNPTNYGRRLDIDVVDEATGAAVFVTLRAGAYHRTWLLHEADLSFLTVCMAQEIEQRGGACTIC